MQVFSSLSPFAIQRWLQCDGPAALAQGSCKDKGLFVCTQTDVLKAGQGSKAHRIHLQISGKQLSNFSSNM